MSKHDEFQTEVCCTRPSVAVMDYVRQSPDAERHGARLVNRCCTKCYAHWFGPVGNVASYTRREWDAYVGATA